MYHDLAAILFLLFAAHCFFDYAGQGDFMSKAKNAFAPMQGVPWYQVLFAHAMIQGAMVYVITGSLFLGLCEVVAHFITDYMKCAGKISYNTDQFIHYSCKVIWVLLIPFLHLVF